MQASARITTTRAREERKKNCGVEQWIIDGIFLIYLLFLVVGLIFKFRPDLSYLQSTVKNPGTFQWTPNFGFLQASTKEKGEMLANLLVFMPFGCFFAISVKPSWMSIFDILTMFLFSVFIEAVQTYFGIGVGDMRDIILNGLGGVLGLIIYRALARVFKGEALSLYLILLSVCMIGFVVCGLGFMNGTI